MLEWNTIKDLPIHEKGIGNLHTGINVDDFLENYIDKRHISDNRIKTTTLGTDIFIYTLYNIVEIQINIRRPIIDTIKVYGNYSGKLHNKIRIGSKINELTKLGMKYSVNDKEIVIGDNQEIGILVNESDSLDTHSSSSKLKNYTIKAFVIKYPLWKSEMEISKPSEKSTWKSITKYFKKN
ncbi:hypothetical protein [Aureibacter tunicatorum]|uniref:Uncharacterized protein n=1 Tax=Aureibacter tunicatorum TaxID=866807 RepID=A0AAE3XQT9_9BACT|nr:hypothetical protein [Aureibacter tunicatorum]MDR6241442.1 hypothetical protein [Aureibacter tunicatorum]BDD06713.1 hypothetical protein AUTU_41960 [Aureibacter tunicatorum]